ncbi:unnamed protein product [Tenebrio molitor]|nr:unnamed protein product [Tenebrio molitor]
MMMKVALFIAFCCVCVGSLPTSDKAAEKCTANNCKIEDDCRCSSIDNPITDKDNPALQLIAINVSAPVVQTLYDNDLAPFFFDRKNPDAPLFIYRNNGSQEYWQEATLEDIEEEFGGQKIISTTFANIPAEDIVGVRTNPLQFMNGDVSINAFVNSDLKYDNSWPTLSREPMLPYTRLCLDPRMHGFCMSHRISPSFLGCTRHQY